DKFNMRILLVLKESTLHERLGVMYLSSSLKEAGHEVRLVLLDHVKPKALKELMSSYSPAVVGYSAMTGEHYKLVETNRLLKEEFDFTAVMGGPHPTFFSEVVEEDGLDAVCIGEGEIAFTQFCGRLESGEAYWETESFVVKHNGEIIRNPLMPLVKDLDILPFPDRALMYEADPVLGNAGHRIFFSMRGCPFKCTYCFNSKYNEMFKGKGPVIRNRSPENVVEEICEVRDRFSLDIVWFEDDTFILKKLSWFQRFCELYKENVKLPFSCNFRANLVDEEVIRLLKDAGLDSVFMGVECGNEELSNTVLQRGLKNEQIIKAAAAVRKYGIKLVTFNLLGLPVNGSYKTDLSTLDLNIKIKPTFAESSLVYPYPGTKLEEYSKKSGLMEETQPFLETNKRSSVFRFSSESEKKKIENLHKLFGLFVEFPSLRPLCSLMCSLRLKPLYTAWFYFWYGYNIKIRIFPFRSFRKELGKHFSVFCNIVRKS
ncbi:MAG: radical SAM protein, partial [Gemmatimonadota bacterium]|nr:radical SAM protein [Gemmatimonadota bacterium]